ncbi:MAG: SIS domain-containing protein [Desulfovibrio sp.]|jgi:D-sedoheptulose 7-phosphate isomerase|nr:SIS domain-containing protein [Desulfovibrio sp.]
MEESEFLVPIETYLASLQRQITALDRNELIVFASLLRNACDQRQQIFIMGNGGSAATASHFVCDFNKGLSYGRERKYRFICLNDNVPSLMALANDVGYDAVFVEQLKNFLQPGDLVIGISGSGNSANVVKAVEYANAHGAVTLALVGYDGGKLKKAAQHCVHVDIADMQIVEDIHMILDHMTMRVLGDGGSIQ